MKNVLKLTFLTVALTTSAAIFAQEVKKDAAAQTPKTTTVTPSKDGKGAPAAGNKMAINEQGVPSKTTTKAKTAAAPAAVDPTKKKTASKKEISK